jgi:PleD family two-component response regulator
MSNPVTSEKVQDDKVARAKVLLVEDDSLQASITKRLLLKNGYDVLWVKDGISAIKLGKTEEPDIILLDVVMPGMDGYEVCRWLKLDESTRGIPVIMLTAKRELADKISGLHVGADDYLPKPYNELELNARIYASLRTKALQDELRRKNRQLEKLLHRLERMAVTDSLTGLYNRYRFHDVLSAEFERTARYGTPFSVVPNTEKRDALITAERIRKSIGDHVFEGIGWTITVSTGIAGMPDQEIPDEDALIRCADTALYRAKEKGRNLTEVWAGREAVWKKPGQGGKA